MSDRQVWISRSKNMLPVIEEARRTFPDAANDSQALTRALFNWYNGRQENSKRQAMDRMEKQLTHIEDELAHMKLMLRHLLGEKE